MGISFFSGGFQYCIVSGTAEKFVFVDRVKCTNPAPDRIRESSEWIYDTLDELHRRHKISQIGFKEHFDLKKIKDLYAHGAPIGVLGYFCSEKKIPIEGYTVRKINGYKFLDLPNKTKTLEWVDQNHRDEGKYWDSNARYAVAIALHRCFSD